MKPSYKGSNDQDKYKGEPYPSMVQDGPMYDSRPEPKKSEDTGPNAPAIYSNPKGK
jgi:hypothetical protein